MARRDGEWRCAGRSAGERSRHRAWCFERLEERTFLTLGGNQLFPDDSPWSRRIDQAPVAANSGTLVANIGSSSTLHPDFGTVYEGAYIGIPYNVVSAGQTPLDVIIDAYPDESDLIDVPIPTGAVIEGDPLPPSQNDGDRHLIVYDEDANVAYELYRAFRPSETGDGKWHADSEAVWDFNVNSFRTPGDTSADAAGLPILPGLVRVDEVLDQGSIDHALRFTVPRSRNQYVWPASHHAGSNNASYPRMGERFRLKSSFDISGFSPANRVILQALKDYGMIVADNGSSWYLSGAPSSRWNDDDLHGLSSILGNNFEAVDLAPRVTSLSPASGPAGTAVTINGLNFSGNAGMLKVFFGTTQATSVTIVSDTQLTAIAPPHAAGAVAVTVQTPYGTSPSTGDTQFAYGAATSSSVAARYLFYNQSSFDGNNAAIDGTADAAARATDKTAYRPNGAVAGFESVSNCSRGITGIMIDLTSGGNHSAITANDFVLKVGNNNSPSAWAAAPSPSAVSVIAGGGVSGSDRVEITWNTGAIRNSWLEVRVLANANTGLDAADVFFWGSRVADTGTSTGANAFETTTSDAAQTFAALGAGRPITDPRDFNRDGSVDTTDAAIVFANLGNLARINIASNGPFAPRRDLGEAGIASALAIAVTTTAPAQLNVAPTRIETNEPASNSQTRPGASLPLEDAAARFFAFAAAQVRPTEDIDFDEELLHVLACQLKPDAE
jgi:hypothetical protein